MGYVKPILFIIVFALYIPAARGQAYPQITVMAKSAGLVVIANVNQVLETGGHATTNVTVQLEIVKTLKGTPTSPLLTARILALSHRIPTPVTFPPTMVGQAGIWFLQSGTNSYQILPRKKDGYSATELFLPLTGVSGSVSSTLALDDQLLAYLVLWYQSLDLSKIVNDTSLLSSLETWSAESPTPAQVETAVRPLIASSSVRQQMVGLTAELRVGSVDALNAVIDNLTTYQAQPQFPYITSAVGLYPMYKSVSWIVPLQRLLSMHTNAPGMDAAAAGALTTIGAASILPVMAPLLDSADPQAQYRAAFFFGQFSIFGRVDGTMHAGPVGPFSTAEP
jgi:hypothetical protein